MAFRDELTGLPGRRALNEKLQRMGRVYTLAMADVDHFKAFNDTHGRRGDQVLRMVAAQLRRVSGGGHAYRYGGEFTLVFPARPRRKACRTWKPCGAPSRPTRCACATSRRRTDQAAPPWRPAAQHAAVARDGQHRRGRARRRVARARAVIKAADQALYKARTVAATRCVPTARAGANSAETAPQRRLQGAGRRQAASGVPPQGAQSPARRSVISLSSCSHAVHAQPFRLDAVLRAQALAARARLPAVTLSCAAMYPASARGASSSAAGPRRPCRQRAVDEHAEHGVFDVRGDPGADIVQRERMFLFVTRSERFGRFAQGIQAQLAQGAASAGVNRRISGSGMAGCWEMGTPCGAATQYRGRLPIMVFIAASGFLQGALDVRFPQDKP